MGKKLVFQQVLSVIAFMDATVALSASVKVSLHHLKISHTPPRFLFCILPLDHNPLQCLQPLYLGHSYFFTALLMEYQSTSLLLTLLSKIQPHTLLIA